MDVKRINTLSELRKLAAELGVNSEWHEPDNQQLEAVVRGSSFDNAGFWGGKVEGEHLVKYGVGDHVELYVQLFRDNELVAEVNLAALFAMACGFPAPGRDKVVMTWDDVADANEFRAKARIARDPASGALIEQITRLVRLGELASQAEVK